MRLTSVVNQLATLGDPEPDDKVVEKYLHVARPRFSQLVLSIETLLDISTLSLEEITISPGKTNRLIPIHVLLE